ncbi:MAG: 2-phospho-L-lactate guanylyltransferase [Actinomycetota bacterium]|nr:2-phospho-L-lactate guanylyltransferase [Actinomycetota bacterium]
MRWTVIVPMRARAHAKSRLRAASDSDRAHLQLVDAIRHDCVTALRCAGAVARVVVVAEQPAEIEGSGVTVLAEPPAAGLNGALRFAANEAARRWPGDAIAAVVGDLAALRAADIDAALTAAGDFLRAAVLDRQGTGTTMLTARPGCDLDPRFGPGSAQRHRASGAQILLAPPGLTTDVDTREDLVEAQRIGVGDRTALVLAARAAGRCVANACTAAGSGE